jgi:hypothetical protein
MTTEIRIVVGMVDQQGEHEGTADRILPASSTLTYSSFRFAHTANSTTRTPSASNTQMGGVGNVVTLSIIAFILITNMPMGICG